MPAFACIFVPDFSVEAWLRAEPELRSQPLAVLEGKAPLQKVFAVNEKARRAGVTLEMTKPQVEACPGLALRNRSRLQEAAAHSALLDCAQSFSPRVEDAGCDTLVLDLAGLEPLFGPLPKIARALARRASDLGLKADIAVASNPDAAMLAARGFSGVTVIAGGKEAEQLGSLPVEVLLGGSFQICRDGPEAAQLLETFRRWGIRNLRDLAALPDVELSERLGQTGIYLQKRARGATSRTLVPVEPPLIFEEVIELEYPLVLLEPLAFLLGRLLEQICDRLGARALATQELRLELELQNGYEQDCHPEQARSVRAAKSLPRACRGDLGEPPHRDPASSGIAISARRASLFHRTLRLPVPLLDPKTFLKLLQLDLRAHPPGAPIVKIHLAAEPAQPRAAQNGLFLPPSPESEKLELTLARIAGIVGEEKVGSLELLDTHRPEGFRMQRFAPSEPQGRRGGEKDLRTESSRIGIRSGNSRTKEVSGRLKSYPSQNAVKSEFFRSLLKPCLQSTVCAELNPCSSQKQNDESPDDLVIALRIFRPPVSVTITMRDGKPAGITCPKPKEIHGEILWAVGPWRSSGDWWEQEGWARDEWDIAVQEEIGIALYRLVRDLLSGRWLVEGTYD